MPEVSKLATLVATLATSGAGSGGNGWHLDWGVDFGEQLANGLGIAKCVSISQMNVRWQWLAYSGWTECDNTGHVVVDGYISARVSDVAAVG